MPASFHGSTPVAARQPCAFLSRCALVTAGHRAFLHKALAQPPRCGLHRWLQAQVLTCAAYRAGYVLSLQNPRDWMHIPEHLQLLSIPTSLTGWLARREWAQKRRPQWHWTGHIGNLSGP